MSVLLGEELDGVPLSDPRLLTYCHQVLSVGNDTTRSLLASFAIALAQHPDQLDLLAADRALMPAAIEEALRCSTPGRGFVRTATRDTEIAGQPIRAGQRVYLLYAARKFRPRGVALRGRPAASISSGPRTSNISRSASGRTCASPASSCAW